jgi:hypothetical protein
MWLGFHRRADEVKNVQYRAARAECERDGELRKSEGDIFRVAGTLSNSV